MLLINALKAKLAVFNKSKIDWQKLAVSAAGLSYADITRACEDAIKDSVIHDRQKVSTNDVLKSLSERIRIHTK